MKDESSKAVALLEKKISPVVEQAQGLEIADEAGMRGAAELLSKINKTLDAVVEEKEKVTKPLNQALTAERKRWKPLETTLEEGRDIVRRKMSAYQTAAKREADEEAARIASRVKPGKGNLSVEKAVQKMEEIEKPAEAVSADSGMVKFRTERKFEVMDVTMLPHEYVLPDLVKIRAKMKEGVELPGVRYYDEEVPVNFR